jgi:hypothetical protein
MFPGESDPTLGHSRYQCDDGIVVRPFPEQSWLGSEGRGLTQGDSFKLSGELLLKEPGYAPFLILVASSGEFPLLEHQASAQDYERDTREKNRREKKENLSPV